MCTQKKKKRPRDGKEFERVGQLRSEDSSGRGNKDQAKQSESVREGKRSHQGQEKQDKDFVLQLLFCFETRSGCVVQVGHEFTI